MLKPVKSDLILGVITSKSDSKSCFVSVVLRNACLPRDFPFFDSEEKQSSLDGLLYA